MLDIEFVVYGLLCQHFEHVISLPLASIVSLESLKRPATTSVYTLGSSIYVLFPLNLAS